MNQKLYNTDLETNGLFGVGSYVTSGILFGLATRISYADAFVIASIPAIIGTAIITPAIYNKIKTNKSDKIKNNFNEDISLGIVGIINNQRK